MMCVVKLVRDHQCVANECWSWERLVIWCMQDTGSVKAYH